MNQLKEKYLDFKELDRYKFSYLLEDGRKVSFIIYKKHFPHLIGLHKLTDIPLIARFNDDNDKRVKATNILSAIREETELADEIVKSSSHFIEIENR